MLKTIDQITWIDLIGTWRNQNRDIITFDISIDNKGNYEFIDYAKKGKYNGIIQSNYLRESNTVLLNLVGLFDIELFQIVVDDINLHFNGNKLVFKRIK